MSFRGIHKPLAAPKPDRSRSPRAPRLSLGLVVGPAAIIRVPDLGVNMVDGRTSRQNSGGALKE